MDRDNFVIQLILRARDSMGPALTSADRNLRNLGRGIDRAKRDMAGLDRSMDKSSAGVQRWGSRLDQTRGKINAIRGPTDRLSASIRRFGSDMDRSDTRLTRFARNLDRNRESIAKFDNEIRGMRLLIIVSQFQALATAALALGDQLVALAGSAVAAGAALGGALAAGAAQAIPAIGLLAAAGQRLKAVFDVVQQVQDAQKAAATQATSATNKQADSMDGLRNAANGVRDAQQGVAEAELAVAQARRENRKEIEDLILAQRRADLQLGESEDKLRQLRSQGVTGFELRGAELDVDEARVGRRRTAQDLTTAQTRPEGIRNSLRQLRDAEEGLARARRSNANARRDAADTARGTVAAARQLDFMQAQLSGAERRLVRSIVRLKDTWKEVSTPITDTIVESFTRAVDRAEQVIQRPSLQRAFQRLATQTARQMDRITGFATSDRSIAFFERQTRNLNNNLQPATTAAIRLSRAFMNIADAAAPTLHRLIEDFARFTGRIENFTQDDRRLREIFEFGERHLHAWLRLAGAIGRLFAAIIAPGGNAGLGAAESGLRTLNFLTQEILKAVRWLNQNPTQVAEHFADSEVVFRRIFDLLVEIGRVLFEIFDPETVDTFADAVELLIPAFKQASTFFADITRLFTTFLQIPGIKQLFETGFGFVIFLRLGGRFRAVFIALLGDTIKTIRGVARLSAAFTGLVTTTGGLQARIAAMTGAWNAYSVAAERAAVAGAAATGGAVTAGGAAAAGAAASRTRLRDPATGRFISAETAAAAGAGGGLLSRGGGLAVGGLRAAGRFALPIVGFMAALDFLSTHGGALDRFKAAIEGATFGLVKVPKRVGDDEAALRDRNRAAGTPNAFIFGGAREERGIRTAIKNNDIDALRHYRRELQLTRKEMIEWGDNDEAAKVTKQINALTEAIEGGRGVQNAPLFKQALDRIKDLRQQGVGSLKELRDQMRITFTFITESARRGSDNWRIAMVTNMQAGVTSVLDAVKDGRIGVRNGLEEITRITRRQMRLIKGHMTDLSADARDALSENFRTARIRAERQLGRLEDATGNSLKVLKRLMATELASYGFTSTEVRRIIRAKRDPDDFSRGSRQTEGTSQGPIRTGNTPAIGGFGDRFMHRPMGGFVGAMGERGQDAIKTILGRGEAVLNWGQQRLVEPALNAAYGFGLDELFRKTRGMHAGTKEVGYAAGGRIPIVPVPGFPGEQANRAILDEIAFVTKRFGLRLTDAYGPGHQSPGHTVYGTAADFSGPDRAMNAAVRFLARRYKVLYDGRFGSTSWPGHGPSTVAGSNAHLHVEFGTKDLGAAAGNLSAFRLPRVEITGAGPMGDIAQAGLDSVRRGAILAARRAINRTLGAGTEGAEVGGGAAPPGELRSWLRRALSITHLLTPGNLSALYGRAMQESGGDPRAVNNWDSNAAAGTPSKGLLQTIGPTFSAYSLPGMKNIFNPIHNAVAAIRYMMATYGHIVGPSSSGYAAGGELPGPVGMAQMIMAHGKEWIINERQKGKLASLTGLPISQLRGALGFTGGPSSFQGGGEVEDRSFNLPDILPRTPGGTLGLINRIFRFIGRFGNVNNNLDLLTREGGAFDQFTANLETFTTNLESQVTRATFKLKDGRVVRAHSELWVSQETLDNLVDTGNLLRRMDRSILRGLRRVNRAIGGIRRGGVDDDERDDLLNFIGQRRNLIGRQDSLRQQRAENLQSRFEQREQIRQLRVDRFNNAVTRNLRPFERGLAGTDFRSRMLEILGATGLGSLIPGIGSRAGIFAERGTLLGGQLGEVTRLRNVAADKGFTEQVDELNDKITELRIAIAENTQALFEARVTEVNARQQLVANAASARIRIAELQRDLGIITPDQARSNIVDQINIQRTALQNQRGGIQGLLAEAVAAGNEQQINDLTQAMLDNEVALLENSAQLKDATGAINETQSFSSSAWQWYRTAIFNGSGALLPQFTPSLGLGGAITPTTGLPTTALGAGGGTTTKVVGIENLDITQNETVDYNYLATRAAWEINTPTT